jgi:hypothetical protein
MKSTIFFDKNMQDRSVLFTSNGNKSLANRRALLYEQVFDNFNNKVNNLKRLKMFDSSPSMDMSGSSMGVVLKEASMKAYLQSFAGFLAIEASMTQAKQLILYRDKITRNGVNVLPFLGTQSPRLLNKQGADFTLAADTDQEFNLNCKVTPNSVALTLVINGVKTTYRDNGSGDLVGIIGDTTISDGSINYQTGVITITLSSAAAVTDTANVKYAMNEGTAPQGRRIHAREGYFLIEAEPNVFDYEIDTIRAAISQKTTNSSLYLDMYETVQSEHLMSINDSLVETLIGGYEGNLATIDLSDFSITSGRFDTMTRVLMKELGQIDRTIAKNTYKAVNASAYVVGDNVASLFLAMNAEEYWVPNNIGFVNGLLGTWKGRPVLTHQSVPADEGYAVHKTIDGEMAPVALGVLLPATDIPVRYSFENIEMQAGGIYSVEGTSFITSDLVQRFKVEQ